MASRRPADGGAAEGADHPPPRASWGLWVADPDPDEVELDVLVALRRGVDHADPEGARSEVSEKPGTSQSSVAPTNVWCRDAPVVAYGWCLLAPRPGMAGAGRRISPVRSPPAARRSAGRARRAPP